MIDQEIGSWKKLFELPDDYLDLIAQIAQGDHKKKYEAKILTFDAYAHVVTGTDDKAYRCKVAVTASASTKPITGSWETNWELYDADGSLGADWVSGWAYKASEDGLLLATNSYSNDPSETVDSSINSAYISYIPYVQAGVNDKPAYYTPEFKRAFAVRLASALTKDVEKQNGLLARYTRHDRPLVERIENMDDYRKPHLTTLAARTRGIRLS